MKINIQQSQEYSDISKQYSFLTYCCTDQKSLFLIYAQVVQTHLKIKDFLLLL